MLQLGEFQELEILRETDPGLFLGNTQGDEVLLPHRYKPEEYIIGDTIQVFIYLDNEERPIATTETPYVLLNEFGYLQCSAVNKYGAFMDWGLVKQLFVPFKEQARPMKQGNWYIVYVYLDQKTDRLVGSSKTNKFLSNENLSIKKYDQVNAMITHITDKGANVIINGKYKGLIYLEDIFEDIRTGDKMKAYVKKIREDQKVDLVLQEPGYRSIEPNATYIIEELEAAGGFLPFHDKTPPEIIKNELGLSKKSFKKAVGSLYKNKQIIIKEDGIELVIVSE